MVGIADHREVGQLIAHDHIDGVEMNQPEVDDDRQSQPEDGQHIDYLGVESVHQTLCSRFGQPVAGSGLLFQGVGRYTGHRPLQFISATAEVARLIPRFPSSATTPA